MYQEGNQTKMSEIEFIPNYIYTVLVLPIVILFKSQFGHSTRLKVLETKDKITDEQLKSICDSNATLESEVHKLIGRVDEHLRRNSP